MKCKQLKLQCKYCSNFAGADVTHLKTFSESEPSIVAVCGSIDVTGCRFASCTSMQGHRMEIIQASLLTLFL